MAGYIGKSQGVTQVDGYNRSEADTRYVNVTGDTMTGALVFNSGSANLQVRHDGPNAVIDNYGANANTLFYLGGSNTTGVYRFHRASDNTAAFDIDASGRVTMPYQPSFSGRMSTGAYTIGPTGWIKIPVDTSIWNTGSNFNTSTNRFTAPVSGKYYVEHSVQLEQNNSITWAYLYPIVNGATGTVPLGGNFSDFTPTGTYYTTNYSAILDLSANDYVEWYVRIVGTSLDVKGGNESHFTIHLLG